MTRASLTPKLSIGVVAFGMAFPTLAAWLYFMRLAETPWAQGTYFSCKVLQFSLPLLAVLLDRARAPSGGARSVTAPAATPSRTSALRLGLVSGGLFLVPTLVLYWGFFRDSELAAVALPRIASKLDDFRIDTLASYVLMALFFSFIHSFLEEYYFRWFIFGRLRRHLGFVPATALSSLAFMAHHVIVILAYVGSAYWPLAIIASAMIALSGAAWAWLYEKTGGLLAPWVSHVLADIAVMTVGVHLLRASLL